jgi:hypothetical protein
VRGHCRRSTSIGIRPSVNVFLLSYQLKVSHSDLNRGREGDELDDSTYNMVNARRRSNSSTYAAKEFKTKFETVEPEPVFEEELHGPMAELDKQSTNSSEKSIEEEDSADKKL